MSNRELSKTYNPKDFEEKWFQFWTEKKYFHAESKDNHKKPYTIVIPPPNVTSNLHMGHGLNNTIQDILIRWKRMMGYNALWMPGTDHAGIATQNVVEKKLLSEGKTRHDLGREDFLKEVWNWKEKYGSIIINQLKKMGCSCDWERERFTMDDGLSKAVREVFVRFYEDGLIYKGKRIVNWCPRCVTALSNEEVEYEDKNGFFYHIKYPVKGEDRYIEVATTRPETMLGDTGVAVNPKDERYKDLIGKTLILPIVNREIPVVADDYTDMEKGTGAVKITPAHDPNDFHVGKRHNLEPINVMNEDGTMNELAGEKYNGMDRYVCRKELVKDLEEADFFIKKEEHNHNVGQCYRCDTVIEPYFSDQWYVKMQPLAEKAIEVAQKDQVKFYPEKWKKVYLHWLDNIEDWCISRQLWWGHRIPIWTCEECGHINAYREDPAECPKCKSKKLKQDEDVLDTWFSSQLWPFSTLGWPDENSDLKYFYPTDVLSTAPEILFFWVARMIMAGLYFMGDMPFTDVYLHSTVRDKLGRKMSKSLGNGIDPLEVIDKHGADALRFTITSMAPIGLDIKLAFDDGVPKEIEVQAFHKKIKKKIAHQEQLDFIMSVYEENPKKKAFVLKLNLTFEEKREIAEILESIGYEENKQDVQNDFLNGTRFANKLWNASRYILMSLKDELVVDPKDLKELSIADQWILTQLQECIQNVEHDLNQFRFNDVAKTLYEFIWHDFCDWYIELSKLDLYSEDQERQRRANSILVYILSRALELLHPIMPYITEEIWQKLPHEGESIMIAEFPKYNASLINKKAKDKLSLIQECVYHIRNIRGEMNIPHEKKVDIIVQTKDKTINSLFADYKEYIELLGKVSSINIKETYSSDAKSATSVGSGYEVIIPLEGLIDLDKEKARINKEIGKVEKDLQKSENKLKNEKFLANAADDVIELEKERLEQAKVALEKLRNNLSVIS